MDFDYAHYMLMKAKKGKENPVASSPAKEAYRKQLAEALNLNRSRILAFKNKPPTPAESLFPNTSSVQQAKAAKPRRSIPQTSERTLDAPEIIDDYYLNLLDWGSNNVLAIALTVYLWDATDSSTSKLMTLDEDTDPITSVSWAPDGRHISVGLNNSEAQLWDSTSNKQLRTLKGTSEAFLHAVASEDQLKRSNDSLLIFSGIYIVLNVVWIQSAGAVGLILANSLNMILRIS